MIARSKDGGLIHREGGRSRDHVVEDHAEAPHVHLGVVHLCLQLRILNCHRQVHHRHLREDLPLALVVPRDLEGTVKGPARRVVEEAVAHEVQDIIKGHVRHVDAAYGLHDPAVLHALLPGLPQGVALVALLRDHLDDPRALPARPGRVLADSKGPDSELGLMRGADLRGVGGIEVVAAGEDHLRGHRLERADAPGRLQGPLPRPEARTEVDELHCRPVGVR
mmetsp:Transcript_84814/g.252789  ORF Transcript_84814/g.252789 Transcript_84814/m.252789 type:complete len:222 (-) Transcript_84814:670-1335(-)